MQGNRLKKDTKYRFKKGDWLTDISLNETFLVYSVGDFHIPYSFHTVECYFDYNYHEHIEYRCRLATEEEINNIK